MGAPADASPDPDDGRILLVEDNPAYTRLVRELLEEAGLQDFEVEWVDTLNKATALLDEEGADLILLDLLLPDNLGTDTLETTLDHAEGTPIVVLTGIDDDDLAREALDLGAVDYLCKGRLDADRLRQSVQRSLDEKTTSTLEPRSEDPDTTELLPLVAGRLESAMGALGTALDHLDPLAPPEAQRELRQQLDNARVTAEGLREIADLLLNDTGHEHVMLPDVLDDALVRLSANGPSGGQIRLEWDSTPTVKGDRARLTRLFEILIGQLLARPSTDPSNLTILADHAEEACTVRITDRTPPPTSPTPLKELFDHQRPTEHLEGALAYNLCQALVEAHHGQLRLEPHDGGTSLTLTLPAVSPAQASRAQARQDESTKSL